MLKRSLSLVLLLSLAVAVSQTTACSSDKNADSGPDCSAVCQGQAAKSQAEIDACSSQKADPACGAQYKDLLACQQGCGDVAARCAGALDTWKKCAAANLPKDAGGGG
jgi:hypothetical protein